MGSPRSRLWRRLLAHSFEVRQDRVVPEACKPGHSKTNEDQKVSGNPPIAPGPGIPFNGPLSSLQIVSLPHPMSGLRRLLFKVAIFVAR
jgi:hypothetical protein